MKKVKNALIKNVEGKSFRIPETDKDGEQIFETSGKAKLKDARLVDLLKIIVFNLPADKITMQDSIDAKRFFDQIQESSGDILGLEEHTHDWITKKVEDFGPRYFGVNAVMIKTALDDFERLHEKIKA